MNLLKKILQAKTFSVFLILFLGEVSNNTQLGAIDFEALQEATVRKASKYTKWTDENRNAVRKYASKHGNAVRHFKKDFPNIKESTVREFKKKYEKQLQEIKKQNLQPQSESTPQRQDDLCFWKNSI